MILLDHDPHAPRLSRRDIVKRLARANKVLVSLRTMRSPSGRGWHRILEVHPAPQSACETVALQLLLGSDPYREAWNLNRAVCVDGWAGGVGVRWSYWRYHWNVLYRTSKRRQRDGTGTRPRTAARQGKVYNGR